MASRLLLLQRGIALPFLLLGAWCLLMPSMVADLGLRPEFRDGGRAIAILIGCFGAQAVLGGLFAWTSRFTRATWAAYGIALIPFFGFNFWFVFVDPVFTAWMALDFAANAGMLALCWLGWRWSAPSRLNPAPAPG